MRVAAQLKALTLVGLMATAIGTGYALGAPGDVSSMNGDAASASCMRAPEGTFGAANDTRLGTNRDLSDACVPQPASAMANGQVGNEAGVPTPAAAPEAEAEANTEANAEANSEATSVEEAPQTSAETRSIFGLIGAIFLGVFEFVVGIFVSIASALGAAMPESMIAAI